MMSEGFGTRMAADCQQRYRRGEWRATIFRDLVIDTIKADSGQRRVLDIGCGRGFDGEMRLQEEIADAAGKFIGIEPDRSMAVSPRFACCYREPLEYAAIEDESIDVAYAVMVLEHVRDPHQFFARLHRILRPGGVFWGITVDRRHYFSVASRMLEVLRIKELYFRLLHGGRAENRYANYPTFYRCNSPNQIRELSRAFSHVDTFGLSRPGDTESCFPRLLAPIFRGLDRLIIKIDLPGTLFLVRCEK